MPSDALSAFAEEAMACRCLVRPPQAAIFGFNPLNTVTLPLDKSAAPLLGQAVSEVDAERGGLRPRRGVGGASSRLAILALGKGTGSVAELKRLGPWEALAEAVSRFPRAPARVSRGSSGCICRVSLGVEAAIDAGAEAGAVACAAGGIASGVLRLLAWESRWPLDRGLPQSFLERHMPRNPGRRTRGFRLTMFFAAIGMSLNGRSRAS